MVGIPGIGVAKRLLVGGTVVMAFSSPAMADKVDWSVNGDVSGSLTLTSDYRFRGISQTFRDPAIQGGLELVTPGRFYVGTWGSMVDKQLYTNSSGFEIDLYGGYRTEIGQGWGLDVGLIQYLYPSVSEFSTLEAYAGVSWEGLSLKFYNSLSNRFFGTPNARNSQYIDLTATYPLGNNFTAIGHVGAQRVTNNSGDALDYRIGVVKAWRGFDFGASFYGTDVDRDATNQAGRTVGLGENGLVFSVGKAF